LKETVKRNIFSLRKLSQKDGVSDRPGVYKISMVRMLIYD